MSNRSEAIKSLGDIEDYIALDALNREREIAQSTYNTTLNSLQNEYNNLLTEVANRNKTNQTNFTQGRTTVGQNAYLATRPNLATTSSRGVGQSGIGNLSQIRNRMTEGQQYSDLANTYYNTKNEIDTTKNQGTASYNLNLESARNSLASQLAGIDTREADKRNQYNQAVAALAEQIAARKQAAADALASRNLQKELADKEYMATAKQNIYNIFKESGYDDAKAYAYGLLGYTGKEMDNFLNSINVIKPLSTMISELPAGYITTKPVNSSPLNPNQSSLTPPQTTMQSSTKPYTINRVEDEENKINKFLNLINILGPLNLLK